MKKFLNDIPLILSAPQTRSFSKLQVEEYPFDRQLLALSPLYCKSRTLYVERGGSYRARVCSTMRSLMSTDLFKDEIEYTPSETEILWLHERHKEIYEPRLLVDALRALNGISLFHEQNHRIVWRLLPKVPTAQSAVIRYLNFTEALVVTLDLALGDEIGPQLSPAFERMKSIYRPSGNDKWARSRNADYRQYLRTLFYASYLLLALVDERDIAKCLDYVFANQAQMNRVVVKRALELNHLFTQNTNREWQARYWKQAQATLAKLQKGQSGERLDIAVDPIDFENEFAIVDDVLRVFRL